VKFDDCVWISCHIQLFVEIISCETLSNLKPSAQNNV